jgi:hypothetical protein
MASTTFIDQQTVILASWLNDVNNTVYNGNFPNGIVNATTVNCTNIVATNANISNLTVEFGNFQLTPSGTKLFISYLGTNVMSVDSSGNIIALGSVTAGATP